MAVARALFILLLISLLGACDFWPRAQVELAKSIAVQASGEVDAWLMGGEAMIIDIARSPLYDSGEGELLAVVTGFASEAIDFAEVPLESVVITIHRTGMDDVPEDYRQFIFLVEDGKPQHFDESIMELLPDIE